MKKQFLGTISALVAIATLAGAQTPGMVAARGTKLEMVSVSRASGSGINIEITTRDETAPYVETLEHPARIVVDLPNTVLATDIGPIPIRINGVKGVRVGTDAAKTTRVVVDLAELCKYEIVPVSARRLILKLYPTIPIPALAAEGGVPVRTAPLPSSQSPQTAPRSSMTASAASRAEPAASRLPAANPGSTAAAQRNLQPAQPTSPAAASASITVVPAAPPIASAPASNVSTNSQGSSGGVTTSLASASPQPNIAQPAPASNSGAPASNASEASAGAPAGEPVAAPAWGGVGGHLGVVFPLITHAGGANTTIADSFSAGFPMGITFHGQGRMVFDMEFVPSIQNKPRNVSLTFHPGLVWGVGHRFGVGMRAAFDINSSQFGFTPLVNKSWPIEGSFFKAYFVEADLPVRFNRPAGLPATNPVTFAMHFGLGF